MKSQICDDQVSLDSLRSIFLKKKLSPTERNYDIGKHELLAVKLALEEWHHWLEGAVYPFTIFADHKN